jgi:hypothetical protein
MDGRCRNMEHLTLRYLQTRKIGGLEGGTPNRRLLHEFQAWILPRSSIIVTSLGVRGKYHLTQVRSEAL